MKWSYKIGEYKGIPVKVHALFSLSLSGCSQSWMQGQNLAMTLQGIAFVLARLVCVVLHELWSCLMPEVQYQNQGHYPCFPLGGVARRKECRMIPEELW